MTSDSTLDELWAPIAGFENLYEVSTLGRVRKLASIQRHPWVAGAVIPRRARILRTKTASPASGGQVRGVRSVTLTREGAKHCLLVSRLVLLTFLSVPAGNNWTAAHKDFDASNNRLDNLEWMQLRKNVQRRRTVKLDAEKAQRIVDLVAQGRMLKKDIAAMFGVYPSSVSKIIRGQRWALETQRDKRSDKNGAATSGRLTN